MLRIATIYDVCCNRSKLPMETKKCEKLEENVPTCLINPGTDIVVYVNLCFLSGDQIWVFFLN